MANDSIINEEQLKQAVKNAVANLKASRKTDKVDIPQPSLSDRIKQALTDYGIIALLLLAIGAYIALNDKLLELNRSMGRVEGQLQILEQQKLPGPTP